MKKIEICIREPKECPHRLCCAVPHQYGLFRFVCDLDSKDCTEQHVFREDCPLEEF